ncbi:MAG TPA: mechanosensitive ion channel family protein [Gemmatimonadaceae bacterium]|nr:mechanosensitive ion channel family protein [Gemmatimonadaceae bacterium]HRQ77305.1 mechanosensitive ion channel family protein [Gemmatimonadaceae bacterium]
MLQDRLPDWVPQGAYPFLLAIQIALIVVVAWLLHVLMRRVIRRIGQGYDLPPEALPGVRRAAGLVIKFGALLLILERVGVSGSVLWTAFTGFAAVGAVAFFAAWSVLSNIFCSMLILSTKPFRLTDYVEILENGEKPGLKGRVADINLIYTTLREVGADAEETGSVLQVPNNLFFQRTVRRWPSGEVPAVWRLGAVPPNA